ncbi:MAG TPA: phosphoadenylyl-sulfate reductase [Bryobacteraceae bacterium]|nr:phosphoadenylyl-sulfate reductase [Bryobacteraceae bacterium]
MFENPEDLIRRVLEENGGRPCLTCSFQAEDMVVLDMARKLRPDIAVVFLETGYHFAETYTYRDRMASLWQLNLVNAMPAQTVPEQEAAHGKLYQTRPDQCCKLRKVEPLLRALADYEIWFTGLRREQSPTRANLAPIETHRLPDGKELLKVSPLAFWTSKEVWSYLTINEIEVLPLYDRGYTSIGCEPCTSLPVDSANARSGRWSGQKLECGIHTFDAGGGAK